MHHTLHCASHAICLTPQCCCPVIRVKQLHDCRRIPHPAGKSGAGGGGSRCAALRRQNFRSMAAFPGAARLHALEYAACNATRRARGGCMRLPPRPPGQTGPGGCRAGGTFCAPGRSRQQQDRKTLLAGADRGVGDPHDLRMRLCCTALHYTALPCTAQHCATLHCPAVHGCDARPQWQWQPSSQLRLGAAGYSPGAHCVTAHQDAPSCMRHDACWMLIGLASSTWRVPLSSASAAVDGLLSAWDMSLVSPSIRWWRQAPVQASSPPTAARGCPNAGAIRNQQSASRATTTRPGIPTCR